MINRSYSTPLVKNKNCLVSTCTTEGSSLCLVQVMEAELQYRQCLTDSKIQQDELVKVKERIISHIRKLIFQGDTVLKEVSTTFNKRVACLPVNMVLDCSVLQSL